MWEAVGVICQAVVAGAFAYLVFFIGHFLWKVAGTFDEATRGLREVTDHAIPILDEAAQTMAMVKTQGEKLDVVTTAAAEVTENVSALTALYASTLGRPLVKVSAFSFATRRALARGLDRTDR